MTKWLVVNVRNGRTAVIPGTGHNSPTTTTTGKVWFQEEAEHVSREMGYTQISKALHVCYQNVLLVTADDRAQISHLQTGAPTLH